jgi:phosphomethylpyrimidine synthase
MTTQIESAKKKQITPAIKKAAEAENVSPQTILTEIAKGHAVLPFNPAHKTLKRFAVVGNKFKTKINANIGRSTEKSGTQGEDRKLKVAVDAGADFIMDLSVGPQLASIRKKLLADCTVPLGTVPIYEAVARTGNATKELEPEIILQVIREQAEQGVDFMTLHAGILRNHIPFALKRVAGIVSRGGSLLAEWMQIHKKENPLYTRFEDILKICKENDVTISLGDGLRPGCLADASDKAQFAELDTIADLVKQARQSNVQVMVEGPGHVPFDQIKMNMEREAKLCDNAPFYVLGPVVTDVAPGYDHITSAIGATAAATYGASLLCYVTPAEHLSLSDIHDVREGVVVYRIAAHAADIAKGIPHSRDWDDEMSKARSKFNWKKQFELAIDPDKPKQRFSKKGKQADLSDHCSMCGAEFCAMRITKRLLNKLK